LKVSGLAFSYKKGISVLDDITFEIGNGEIATLLGRSGSGKTTVLNMIAGFLEPLRGRIEMDGKDVRSLPPGKRDIGMVMQDLSLFPNMTASQNVEYGLRARGVTKAEAKERSLAVMEGMDIADKWDRNVLDLSGGERQRIALARSIVYRPRLLLMDEPLSSLDPALREGLRREVKELLKAEGITTLYVTHDRTEALSVSDRIFIMDSGRIVESGDPHGIYRRPRTLKGASFMGVLTPIPVLSLHGTLHMTPFGPVSIDGGPSDHLGYHPEYARWSDPGDAIRIKGKVSLCEFRGSYHLIEVSTRSGIFAASSSGPIPIGARAEFFIRREDLFPLK